LIKVNGAQEWWSLAIRSRCVRFEESPRPGNRIAGAAVWTEGLMTRNAVLATIALTTSTVLLGVAALAARGDPENGLRLAERWCAACHVVSPDQREANADAPAFAAIGQRPGFSAEQLARFLMEPHPKMPSMSLTRQEAIDLAAYIAKTGEHP
jgi:mono/diheme cytochrome c family protein